LAERFVLANLVGALAVRTTQTNWNWCKL